MSGPGLFVIGANHHRAPLEVREKLALAPGAAPGLHADLVAVPGLREFAVLSTCNRIEFYGVVAEAAAVARVAEAYCARQNFDPAEFERFRLEHRDAAAIRHLVAVASGLDSQMVGENEIFGQVKEAYAAAQAGGHTGPVLNRVFQKGFQAAKHVRANTAITEGTVSVANVAVDLALSIFGNLAATRILLLGAGEIGEKTAKAFQSRGAAALTVASRTLERAMELATVLGASAMPFEQREARLAEFDIVVCATSAPTAVVSHQAVKAAIHRRPAKPLFFIDQALPRDVEPTVAGLQNVFLYNLDDLAKIAEANRAARAAELAKCHAIVADKAGALWSQVAALIHGGDSRRSGSAAPRESNPTSLGSAKVD